ncbi:hypothetical protein SAMN04489724_1056 [Algoriphagus locisalis]|uniref:Uncharacterized protein n=1 Tax=Algoriphagus locisalis TaxID=305507 RepID=A0A1I6YKL5_9BACT|nr:hypothetical protein [Algoriphagus locisalis]SFT50751.1 hypothetical protein SAMN04489724_1056 [Algoriphagus locisalis]
MKFISSCLLTVLALVCLFTSCQEKTNDSTVSAESPAFTYSLSIEAVNDNYLAPALQSFAHATHNDEWLLFAGRTNGSDTLGGLHNLNADYSLESFPPKSFNPFIYTFSPTTGNQSFLNYGDMLSTIRSMAAGGNGESEEIRKICEKVGDLLTTHSAIFMCTNPQVVQSGDYLYLVGGYGPPAGQTPTAKNYSTFDEIAKINVPLLMRIVNGEWNLTVQEWGDLFRFGNNPTLRATGGELKKIDDFFYLAAGHNFNNDEQVYLNSVYQFKFSEDVNSLVLSATVTDTISDITPAELLNNPKKADSTSVFRRRDLPIVPSLYLDTQNKLAPNFALFGGVFKYGETLAAWNDAIYITPDGADKYFIDAGHDQMNCNIYSCPDFSIYDSQSMELHTFLPGGIGNGKADNDLSGFTNTLGYSKFNLTTKVSSFDTLTNFFPSTYFYGAEAVFIPTSNANYLSITNVKTDVIDAESTFESSDPVHIGYIYGGIESYETSPSTYGSGKSGASNKVWKVLVSRTQVPEKK